MTDAAADRREIRELIENWAIWRDARDWDRFRTVWHDDGRMMATWWQGPCEEFIRVSQEGWDRGIRILHFLGGSTIEVDSDRAIAQTKMTITQRVDVHDVLCDVVCTGRFYDFLARRDGRWGLVLRQPIYEIDRLTPVSPVPGPPSTPRSSPASPRATATSPTCRRSLATRSKLTCPASKAPSSRSSTPMGRSGFRADPSRPRRGFGADPGSHRYPKDRLAGKRPYTSESRRWPLSRTTMSDRRSSFLPKPAPFSDTRFDTAPTWAADN